jgi:hypothetical protein
VQHLNDPKLFKFLDDGFGNHPSIVRALVKYDKLIGESKSAEGGSTLGEKTTAEVLYPSQGK